MMYDLIEVTPKLNKKKVFIVSVIAIVVILLFIFIIIKAAKAHKQNKNNVIENTVAEENIVENENEKEENQVSINMNPSYTETGRELMKNIYHSEEKIAYLTFDDGPSKSVTPLLLDLFKQEDIKVTFFVLGSRAELNPDLIKREYDEGHYIANHGYSHIYGNIYSSVRSGVR